MPDETPSVAPKERVNITYRSLADGAQEQRELPFKVLVAGDFSHRQHAGEVKDREVISVNKDNFGEVMAKQDLQLDVRVPDPTEGGAGADLSVSLKIKSLKDFEPDALVANVPELRKLYAIREALKELKSDDTKLAAVKQKLAAILGDEAKLRELVRHLESGNVA